MGSPAAKECDSVNGACVHTVSGSPATLPFVGQLLGKLSNDVFVLGARAATKDSTADNIPPHAADKPPTNKASMTSSSTTVRINDAGALRSGDTARTCTEAPIPDAVVLTVGTVFIGSGGPDGAALSMKWSS